MWADDDDLPGLNSKSRSAAAAANPTKKLSSLFAQEENLSAAGNSALAFTGKKAPKPANNANNQQQVNPTLPTAQSQPQPTSSAPSTSVIFATLANLIRYDSSGQANVVGPRASAILRNSLPSGHYVNALVCYDPQSQKQECVGTLNENFVLTVNQPSYCMFYDDTKTYYCLQLNNDQLELLIQNITITKYSQSLQLTTTPNIVIQDLSTINNNDRGINNNDQIKIKYTMNLLSSTQPFKIGSLIGTVGTDEKPKPMRVGSKKELQGIEIGVIGMKKGGRRLLIIPPHLAYGTQAITNIPPNSAIVVEITVLKVKHAEGNTATPATTLSTSTTPAIETTSPAVTITPAPSSVPVPALPANLTIPAPGGAAVPSSAASIAGSDVADSDDDDDNDSHDSENNRAMLAKKMANISGFKMPGLPGAVDPEHLAASMAAKNHENIESREGQSTPASPIIQNNNINNHAAVPPMTAMPISAGHTRMPSNASTTSSNNNNNNNSSSTQIPFQSQQQYQQPPPPPQQQQQSSYYQPNQQPHPSQYSSQQPQPHFQPQQQPPHSYSHPNIHQMQQNQPIYSSSGYHNEGAHSISPSHTQQSPTSHNKLTLEPNNFNFAFGQTFCINDSNSKRHFSRASNTEEEGIKFVNNICNC